MNLSDCSKGRNNNLNLIRFVAAILVIYSHSFPLTANGVDYLGRITNGQIDFGGVAVSIFFFYGGFLICKSMCRLETAKDYFKARCIRIIPPLAVVTFFLAFVVGPFFTSYSLGEYFLNIGTYKYLLNSVFVLVHNLPGVFTENSYGATVNGPLWTLPVEFMCYIMCYVLYRLRLLKTSRMKILAILAVSLYIILYNLFGQTSLLGAALRPVMLFFVGMFCYIYREHILIKWQYVWMALIGCVIGLWLNFFNVIIFICFTYVLLWIAFGTNKKFDAFGSKFELSYGMYLTGWPFQQILCDLTNNQISQWWNFVIATIASIGAGVLICLLEKSYMTRLKQRKEHQEESDRR